jgi:hypothetical protein
LPLSAAVLEDLLRGPLGKNPDFAAWMPTRQQQGRPVKAITDRSDRRRMTTEAAARPVPQFGSPGCQAFLRGELSAMLQKEKAGPKAIDAGVLPAHEVLWWNTFVDCK